ncbi:hypothetical protein ACJ6WF_16885 [Streptomyces sp. MMS24-I2-30]|uniref:hypothetical protein n=1 Tax=Streptomyces sp. MMS24-I2-30 TaxID=3351564 RepID=UPI003896A4B1
MPRQLDQLPADTTTLARRIRDLERQVTELRASRRAAHTAVSEGAVTVYRPGSDIPAALMSPDLGDGNAGFQTNADDGTYARLESGEMTFGAREVSQFLPTGIRARAVGGTLDIQSGMISGGAQAHILMVSGDSPLSPGNGAPMISLMWDGSGQNDMIVDVSGLLLPRNMVWGSVTITPSAANIPTSVTVSGLTVRGATFTAQVTPAANTPGTQVTGVGATNVTSSGLTVWLTRTNLTATTVYWEIKGQ